MKFLFTLLGLSSLVAAHGYVDRAQIGGQNYQFYQPYSDPWANPKPQRISREIQGNGPIEDVSLIDLQCGGYTAGGVSGSKPAPLHANAAAGSEVTLYWTVWPSSHVGPAITYMARCPDAGCNNWLPGTSPVWFKVHQAGLSNGVWGATPLMTANNAGYKFTIPSCLARGYYLVRHELIALHGATTYPGAQFYPSCFQLNVSGSGSARPSSGLVSFPGAYRGSDPGVAYNAYAGATSYPIPGPSVFRC